MVLETTASVLWVRLHLLSPSFAFVCVSNVVLPQQTSCILRIVGSCHMTSCTQNCQCAMGNCRRDEDEGLDEAVAFTEA
jgi:hypothetical protein